MQIFQNDHEVLNIGNLSFENQQGKVIIHGEVEIGMDETGRAQAQALLDFAKSLVVAQTQASVETELDNVNDSIDNPFA